MSDKLRTSRVKVYCPKCEESYLPRYKNMSLDGSFFGTSFPQIFLKNFPYAIILPPKVYYYEPKIFGFKIVGKRGSKYHKPVSGPIRYPEEENIDKLISDFKDKFRQQRHEEEVKSND